MVLKQEKFVVNVRQCSSKIDDKVFVQAKKEVFSLSIYIYNILYLLYIILYIAQSTCSSLRHPNHAKIDFSYRPHRSCQVAGVSVCLREGSDDLTTKCRKWS